MTPRPAHLVPVVVLGIALAGGADAQVVPQGQGRQPVNATLIPRGDSTYIVVVGADTLHDLHVITTSMIKTTEKAIMELRARRQEVAALESLQQPYERVVNACTNARALDDSVIKLQGEQIADYKDLANRLEKLKNPWVTWQFGAGKDSAGPALLAGIGVKRLRVFGTVHEGRNAWFLGYSGRVF